MSRINFLENQMDRDDLSSAEFKLYNDELNAIYAVRIDRTKQMKAEREEQLKQELEEQAMADVMSITDEEVERMYVDSCTKYQDVNGLSFEKWHAQSLKYYHVDTQHTVHARARSSNTVELVQHVSQAHAKLTILQRIKHKFYDHAVRSRNFRYEIEDT